MVKRLRKFCARGSAVLVLTSIGILTLLGSGGGGTGGGGSQALEGVWVGSKATAVYICLILCWLDHAESGPAMALARADGEIHLLPWNLTNSSGPSGLLSWHLAGRASVSGSQVSGTLRLRCDPLDGPPLYGHANIEGSVAARVAMDVEYQEDECVGSGMYNLDYDPLTDLGASAQDVAGVWSNRGSVVNVGMDGKYDGSTAAGCILSGTITPVSAEVNLYNISTLVENCSSLNGSYAGLAAIIPDQFGLETLVLTGRNDDGAIALAAKR
jgi:hypothetical protein